MKKRTYFTISIFAFLFFSVFVSRQNVADAQIRGLDDAIYMFGTFDTNRGKTGFFNKSSAESDAKKWCVFVGKNGSVYKLSLIDKSVGELFVDGKRIPDGEIWKRTAEFKSYLGMVWKQRELEAESERIDANSEEIDSQSEEIDRSEQRIDKAEEKLDKFSDERQADISKERENLRTQRERLNKLRESIHNQREPVETRQSVIERELNSIDMIREMDKILDQVIVDLKSVGVIKDSKNLSFKLSNRELVVNGKRISTETFELLKTKYIAESTGETGFLYRWKPEI
jgi:bla regulator protein blaR1